MFAYVIAVGLLFIAVAVVLHRRISEYNALLDYDPAADYPSVVDPAFGRTLEVEANSEGLIWPRLNDQWDSAFIALSVNTDLIGRVLDPYVEIELGGTILRQYFERGAAGTRLLNVTPFLRSEPSAGSQFGLTDILVQVDR